MSPRESERKTGISIGWLYILGLIRGLGTGVHGICSVFQLDGFCKVVGRCIRVEDADK